MACCCMQENILCVRISSEMISNSVKSFTLSKRFIRALVKTTILNIMYQRLVLNKDDLKCRRLGDVPFMVFKRNKPQDFLLRQYLKWVEGIEDAIKKNYLRDVFMFMKSFDSDQVIETYRFQLTYNTDEGVTPARTSTEARRATKDLLDIINQLGKRDKLNENTVVKLELTYAQATPPTYEPPGFEAAIEKHCVSINYGDNHLGTVQTGFHQLSCYGAGEVFDQGNSSTIVLENETETYDRVTVDLTWPAPEEHELCMANLNSPKDFIPIQLVTISDVYNGDDSNPGVMNLRGTTEQYTCLCELVVPMDVDVIDCIDCKKQYHAPCHGFTSRENAHKVGFSCVNCKSKDRFLRDIPIPNRLPCARLRLVSYYIDKTGELPVHVLNMFTEIHRINIIEKLECLGVLIGKNRRVNPVALRKVMEKLFDQDDSQTFEDF